MPIRILYLVSHPIQYQAPLLRLIATDTDVDLLVLFERMDGAGTYKDAGFGRDLAWDIPVTDGYRYSVIKSKADILGFLKNADVLWVHGWDSGLKRRMIAKAQQVGVPVLMRGENTDAAMPDGGFLRGAVKRAYLHKIFNHCAGFLCIGSDNRAYYQKRGIPESKLFSMPYTVDNDFFRERADIARNNRVEFREELGLEPGRPIILYAGKMQDRKHPLTLLAAFRGLDMDRVGHPYLIYVGDGAQKSTMEQDAQDLGDRVRILGFKNQTELPAFFDLADIFVLASEKEPWGLAVNEAMNGQTAVIVSNQCGCAADLIRPDCGRIIEADDAAALRIALEEMLRDPEELARMGEAAKKSISKWGLPESQAGLREALIQLKLLSA